MHLGLERGKTELLAHDKEWESVADQTIGALWKVIPEARDIQHVGSTAIRSIAAKPIVDAESFSEEVMSLIRFSSSWERVTCALTISIS